MGGDLGHFVGHVQECEALEAAGVGGEKGGGQGTALHAHSGQNGDGDRQGAAAEAGHIVNGGNAGSQHGKSSFREVGDFQNLRHCIADFGIVQEKREGIP